MTTTRRPHSSRTRRKLGDWNIGDGRRPPATPVAEPVDRTGRPVPSGRAGPGPSGPSLEGLAGAGLRPDRTSSHGAAPPDPAVRPGAVRTPPVRTPPVRTPPVRGVRADGVRADGVRADGVAAHTGAPVNDPAVPDAALAGAAISDAAVSDVAPDGIPGPRIPLRHRRRRAEEPSSGGGPIPDIDPRMARRRAEVDRARIGRRLQLVAGVGAVIALLVVTLGVLHTGLLGVRHIRVAGNRSMPESELLRAAGIRSGEPLIDIDGSGAARRLEALPAIATATVQREWPTTVRIVVTLRTAVAQIPIGASLNGPVAEIDSTGRVLARSQAARADLPLLVGVGTPGPVGSWVDGSAGSGQQLGRPATRPLSVAASVADATGAVRVAIAFTAGSEAATASSGGLGTYRVARVDVATDGSISAIVTPGPVTVVLGDSSALPDKLTALVSMLRTQHLPDGSTLDLQVPDRPTVASTAGLAG